MDLISRDPLATAMSRSSGAVEGDFRLLMNHEMAPAIARLKVSTTADPYYKPLSALGRALDHVLGALQIEDRSPQATNRERKCADTTGTVPVPWAGHFQCSNSNTFFK